MSETTVKTGHPKGLWVLFGTEMWERFNFYGMRAILTLFMVNSLMMKEEEASIIYGGFLGLCYLTPMLAGELFVALGKNIFFYIVLWRRGHGPLRFLTSNLDEQALL